MSLASAVSRQGSGPEVLLVGYTFRGRPAGVAFEAAASYGYDGIELRNFPEVNFSSVESVRKSLETVAPLAAETRIPVTAAFIAPILASDDNKETETRLGFYREILAVLAEQNVRILHTQVRRTRNVNGKTQTVVGSSAQDDDFDAAAAALRAIGECAAEVGVVVAVESHMGTIHDLAFAQHRLIARVDLPSVTASLDFCNIKMVHAEEDLDEVIDAFAGRIGYAHCKNLVREKSGAVHWNVSLAHGHLDYGSIVSKLESVGFKGPYGIEYCGPGDPHVYAREDAEYLRSVLERIRRK